MSEPVACATIDPNWTLTLGRKVTAHDIANGEFTREQIAERIAAL